jgi:tetratricopeptide (TPR) repeat protein
LGLGDDLHESHKFTDCGNRPSARTDLCLGLAEQGKIYALARNHADALRHYREALRMARGFAGGGVAGQGIAGGDVFFLYVTQCIMESLELSGALPELADYCAQLEAHFAALPPHLIAKDPAIARIRMGNVERHGLALLQMGEEAEAAAMLGRALALAAPADLPVAKRVKQWLDRRFQVDVKQLRKLQSAHGYFMVRADSLRADIAVRIPQLADPASEHHQTV